MNHELAVKRMKRSIDFWLKTNPITLDLTRPLREEDEHGNVHLIGELPVSVSGTVFFPRSPGLKADTVGLAGGVRIDALMFLGKPGVDIQQADRFDFGGRIFEVKRLRERKFAGTLLAIEALCEVAM
jgi:hypothetical protein